MLGVSIDMEKQQYQLISGHQHHSHSEESKDARVEKLNRDAEKELYENVQYLLKGKQNIQPRRLQLAATFRTL